jgi:8-hydroxy-5-deazaflavin:NADPH oxidoreductase
MRVGILGAGPVGQALAAKLREVGHDVAIGTRTQRDGTVSYADAAREAELLVNATSGHVSLAALEAAGAESVAGKILVDVSNALDFGGGFPPTVGVAIDDSVAERIQRAYPDTRVVKTLNTINLEVMVDPAKVPGDHVLFVCGNDEGAKAQVVDLLESFGWPGARIVDLGDLTGARAAELYVALWLRLMGTLGSPYFNIALHQA